MNVVLIGEESAGLRVLRALAISGHRIAAVLASPLKSPNGGPGVWDQAREMGIPVLPANRVKSPALADQLRDEGVDILLNVHSLFTIHPEVLRSPRIGAFNLHPGPLPRYAGRNALSWALYRDETTYGVTVHWLTAELDAGPIAYQSMFPIERTDTALTVTLKCVKAGLPLISRLLAQPEAIPRIEQDLSQREYFGRNDIPHDGRLSWSRTAREVVNLIRACDYLPFVSPWGHPKTRLGDQEIAVLKAIRTGEPSDAPPGTVGDAVDSSIRVASADEWILIGGILVDGRPTIPSRVLRSGDVLGETVGSV